MLDQLEPKRLANGCIDLEWWNNLSIAERSNYNVWVCEVTAPKNSSEKVHVVIDPEMIDTSKIDEATGNHKTAFRPTQWNEMIGQYHAKERIQCYVDGCAKSGDLFPHVFLSAPAGHGKTIFADILAMKLGKKMVKISGGDIKSEQFLADKIAECKGGILFIDECHRVSTKIGSFMLTILEEWLIVGKKINPFICIMASTHKGNLSQNLSALVQRFTPIELNHYDVNELVEILQQYHKKSYANVNIDESVFKMIAANCKFTPRIAINYLKEYVYTESWDKVRKNNRIVKDGITDIDIQVLRYLKLTGGAGKNSLAKSLKIEPKTYEFEIEPYLIFKEFITVDNKRKISEAGKEFLECLK